MRKRVAEILMTIAKILPFVVMLALVALYLPNKDAVSVDSILRYTPDNLWLAALAVLALLGSSGCGKSLTCAAALGLLPPGVRQTAGRVLLDGIPVHGEQLRGATIATIMQNPRSAFNPLQTMAAHARETCRAAGREANDAVLLAAMEEVGLDNPRALLKRYPFEMSGGMLQRMMVALALLSRAPFIIADEPTTDLDTIAQARILDLLADIVARRGLGLLLVTHDMGVVARLAHHVTVMENGRLVEHCDVNTLFSAPRHPLSQRLLAAHLALYGLEKTP